MIDLSTRYLGMDLANPLVVSASPLCEDLATLRALEEAGAAAVVLHSLFEEQLTIESYDLDHFLAAGADTYPEALSYFPDMTDYNTGPGGYLDHLREAKAAVRIPVIASLNGVSQGKWLEYAHLLESAGADALELNAYFLPTDPDQDGATVERMYLDLVKAVKRQVQIPVAVKLGPFFSAPVNMARRLGEAGAEGLVLFNRFYQPDFDLEALDVVPHLALSHSSELLLRLHWVALMHGRVRSDLAITGGVHTAQDVLKALMAGANVAMLTSALLKHGVGHLTKLLSEVRAWMEEHDYESVRQLQGSMSYQNVAEPAAFERANYLRVLRAYALRG
jgi:dihydroorotate dehydrogenase (fumarate)